MNDDTRLLILPEELTAQGRLGGGIERKRVLRSLAEAGVHVSEDSGGRLLVIEGGDDVVRALEERIPGVRIARVEEGVSGLVGEVDAQDALFVRALDIRLSADYLELKRNQKPGGTPEEQMLLSGPCIPPED